MRQFTFSVLFFSQCVFSICEAQSFEYAKIPKTIGVIEKNHIAPISIGTSEINEIINEWLHSLDEDKTLFLQSDIANLNIDNSQLRDKEKLEVICTKVLKLYKLQLKTKDSITEKVLKLPFNFQQDQSIVVNQKEFCQLKKEKENRIIGLLKLKFYDAVLSDSISIPKIEFKNLCIKDDVKQRKIILDDYIEEKSYREKTDIEIENFIASSLLSSICLRFDPHTEYFSATEKIKFEKLLSKEVFMFGFSVGEDEQHKPNIISLKAGGAAWKTGEINKDDQIIKIEFLTSKKQVNINNQSAAEINELFDKYSDQEIYLTIKKQNGEAKRIYLAKQAEAVESNIVSSYILQGTNKVAYLELPAFYTDFDPDNVNGSANDIAKEIVKLKREKIQGLILDLRNNGGGSIEEATNIAGIFVNEGPLAQIKYKIDKPVLLKDMNRGFIYDGPLIILVNHFSASASELVSMILQDYNRAIIVGAATFGKASGQGVLPVIENFDLLQANEKTKLEANDYVKTTILKIYNVEGQSYQGNGVQPDVVLPDIFHDMPFGEKYEKHFLKPDAITKKVVINPFPNNLRTAIAKNKYGTSVFFKSISAYADTIGKIYNENKGLSLKLENYYDNALRQQVFYRQMEKLIFKSKHEKYKIDINAIDKDIFISTEDKKMISNKVTDLQDDMYLLEAYNIMEDMIKAK
jgi:carboxyl-terminal processing protease